MSESSGARLLSQPAANESLRLDLLDIVGPLHRVKKLAHEIAAGSLTAPSHGLRPTDELKDVFEGFFEMVEALRARHEEDLRQATDALRSAEKHGAHDEVLLKLQTMEARLKAKLE